MVPFDHASTLMFVNYNLGALANSALCLTHNAGELVTPVQNQGKKVVKMCKSTVSEDIFDSL